MDGERLTIARGEAVAIARGRIDAQGGAPMRRLETLSYMIAALAFCSPATAEEVSGTLKKLKDGGSITLGYREATVPFSYKDDKGNVHGYAIDLCQKVVEALKTDVGRDLKVDFAEVTAANRIRLIKNGSVDLECGSTTNTQARALDVAFAVTHFVAGNRYLSKRSLGIQEFEDLKGLTVVSLAGTTNIKQVVDLNNERGLEMEILPASSPAEALQVLESNRASAFFWDDILLAGIVTTAKNPKQYVISDDALSVEPYAIMLPKDDAAFKEAVDNALIGVYRSGAINDIYAKWFLSPIPPDNVNLNVPMSAALAKVVRNPTSSGDPAAYR